jgi:hypothetical protein
MPPSDSIRVTTSRGRCPDVPVAALPANLITEEVDFSVEPGIRLFWDGAEPLRFGVSKNGNRFDPLPPPWEHTRVLYAGTSLETAIAETVMRWHGNIRPGDPVLIAATSQLVPRRVARFVSKRKLAVVNATGFGMARIEAAVAASNPAPSELLADDIFNCSASCYSETQAWGSWFRTQRPDADGLMWVSRQFNRGRCIVLFEDRCSDQLQLTGPPVPLYDSGSPEKETVDEIFRQIGWGIE